MTLSAIAGIGSAIVGGFYVAFAFTVMPALRRRPVSEAGAAMVSINERAVRLPFMVLFFGTALACAGTVARQVLNPVEDSATSILGAACYLTGWLLTMTVNVPLNNRLARSNLGWAEFEKSWNRANLTRAVLSVAGGALLILN
ncbi:DUF1772 domain-containing protein [Arthrobacter sulfonylureivorans]|uniref:DUF1772 domain-containing protein n=1 Tax=Arthrobacter sulfonylureivorans TaxID=2486855 RepID=A0ABY3WED9_9MICC|nr:anthrone oxygenase family protein [Arthrobacter sulfonylureivorans]UNK47831.1 DUF1772 domain-containing protein [Arthrobacter sulfonylureivorans]